MLIGMVVLAGFAGLAVVLVERGDGGPNRDPDEVTLDANVSPTERARAFVDRYVDDTGRVVRHDQGGDTVSEGQAYAMLLAVGLGDRPTFDRVWNWTRVNLQRSDRLLSWHWADGGVVDGSSASDADLDAARALVLAGRRFGDGSLTREGIALGRAVLDLETQVVGSGRVLLPGPWAERTPPYLVNPSYASPVATRVLYSASRDWRWRQLENGSRAVVQQLMGEDRLPPDWARVAADGSARPTLGPSGEPVQFGFESQRTVLRHAESCVASDRRLAASARALLTRYEPAYAVYLLDGTPSVEYSHALSYAARAAALSASGLPTVAAAALADSDAVASAYPSYYGDAWAALGRMMLTDRRLGGCPAGVG